MGDESIIIGPPVTSWTTVPLISYHTCCDTISYSHSRRIDDDPPTVYLCPYCESIYDKYHSNCKNCGAPLQMKPIRRCE